MAAKKKLLILKISESLYENLKRSANISCRALGHELALRIEYALSKFENKTFKEEKLERRSILPTDIGIQIHLNADVHSKLKTLASSLNMFIKELAFKILVESDKKFESIASSENVILRTSTLR